MTDPDGLSDSARDVVAVLTSGGLDSCVLAVHLAEAGRTVQPMYVRSGLYWQETEEASLRGFIKALRSTRLLPLKTFDLPLADAYGDHWSVTGHAVPDAATDDSAVYLPGRNALLLVKPALWCRLNGIRELAVGSLGTNPFADAQDGFFRELERVVNRGPGSALSFTRPLSSWTKRDVMTRGRDMPLHLTFCCLKPEDGEHCGICNKCAERRLAFACLGADPTCYRHEANTDGVHQPCSE